MAFSRFGKRISFALGERIGDLAPVAGLLARLEREKEALKR